MANFVIFMNIFIIFWNAFKILKSNAPKTQIYAVYQNKLGTTNLKFF